MGSSPPVEETNKGQINKNLQVVISTMKETNQEQRILRDLL